MENLEYGEALDEVEDIFAMDPEATESVELPTVSAVSWPGLKWAMSRVVSNVLERALWTVTERHGDPDRGAVEQYIERHTLAFREMLSVVIYPKGEITQSLITQVRREFSEKIHVGLSYLVNLEWLDPEDHDQGALMTLDGYNLVKVKTPEGREYLRWIHHQDWTPIQEVEFQMVAITVDGCPSRRFWGLPEDIDCLLRSVKGKAVLHSHALLVDEKGNPSMWTTEVKGRKTYAPIYDKAKKTWRPRWVSRVSKFVKMPIHLPDMTCDGEMAWVQEATDFLTKLAGGMRVVDHGDGITTEVLVPGGWREPDRFLEDGTLQRVVESSIDPGEVAHYKANEVQNRLDDVPEAFVDPTGEIEWIYRPTSVVERHTMQDFMRGGVGGEGDTGTEFVGPERGELDLESDVQILDVGEDKIDMIRIAFSHFDECHRCGYEFDHGLELKCPECGQQALPFILWSSDRFRTLTWNSVRINQGVEWRGKYIGGTQIGEFLSCVRRNIRDGEGQLELVTPWMFERDLDEWRQWVDDHGDDQDYPGAKLKRARLNLDRGRTPKPVWFAKMFKNPRSWRRMLFSTPDGWSKWGAPNRIYKVRGELRNGMFNKIPLNRDYSGNDMLFAHVYFDLEEKAQEMGLNLEMCPTRTLVVKVANEWPKEQAWRQALKFVLESQERRKEEE